MKHSEIKIGQKVFDTGCPYSIGIVEKKLKTRAHIKFPDHGLISYDRAHCTFLRPYDPGMRQVEAKINKEIKAVSVQQRLFEEYLQRTYPLLLDPKNRGGVLYSQLRGSFRVGYKHGWLDALGRNSRPEDDKQKAIAGQMKDKTYAYRLGWFAMDKSDKPSNPYKKSCSPRANAEWQSGLNDRRAQWRRQTFASFNRDM